MLQEITIKIDVPEGYRVLDYREPRKGETFINYIERAEVAHLDLQQRRIILEKKPWEPKDRDTVFAMHDAESIQCVIFDKNSKFHVRAFKNGEFFQTAEIAYAARIRVKELLMKIREENNQ
jgi:hypothetical protein